MCSVPRVLGVLVLGLALAAGPALLDVSTGVIPAASASETLVEAQTPTSDGSRPAPPGTGEPRDRLSQEQRTVIGALGAVLILLVLLSRKARGKSVLGVRWRKKG